MNDGIGILADKLGITSAQTLSSGALKIEMVQQISGKLRGVAMEWNKESLDHVSCNEMMAALTDMQRQMANYRMKAGIING